MSYRTLRDETTKNWFFRKWCNNDIREKRGKCSHFLWCVSEHTIIAQYVLTSTRRKCIRTSLWKYHDQGYSRVKIIMQTCACIQMHCCYSFTANYKWTANYIKCVILRYFENSRSHIYLRLMHTSHTHADTFVFALRLHDVFYGNSNPIFLRFSMQFPLHFVKLLLHFIAQ